MIKKCIICGKEFENIRNAKTCSKACRAEAIKKYQREYRRSNWDIIKDKQKEYYDNRFQRKQVNEDIIVGQVVKVYKPKKMPMPDSYKASSWGKTYYKAERLDRIVMLSRALSEYNLEKLTYGYLSAMYETGAYMRLLNQVLKIKELEVKKSEKR